MAKRKKGRPVKKNKYVFGMIDLKKVCYIIDMKLREKGVLEEDGYFSDTEKDYIDCFLDITEEELLKIEEYDFIKELKLKRFLNKLSKEDLELKIKEFKEI